MVYTGSSCTVRKQDRNVPGGVCVHTCAHVYTCLYTCMGRPEGHYFLNNLKGISCSSLKV